MKWIVRLGLAAAANGLLLLLAAVLFDKFQLSFAGWIVATVLFTVLTMALRGVMSAIAGKYASGATFLGGLATTWVALLVTDLLTSRGKFDLEGFGTWIWTILIVWVGTLIYDQVDDRLIDAVRGSSTKS
jgi:hypothetical protein